MTVIISHCVLYSYMMLLVSFLLIIIMHASNLTVCSVAMFLIANLHKTTVFKIKKKLLSAILNVKLCQKCKCINPHAPVRFLPISITHSLCYLLFLTSFTLLLSVTPFCITTPLTILPTLCLQTLLLIFIPLGFATVQWLSKIREPTWPLSGQSYYEIL